MNLDYNGVTGEPRAFFWVGCYLERNNRVLTAQTNHQGPEPPETLKHR